MSRFLKLNDTKLTEFALAHDLCLHEDSELNPFSFDEQHVITMHGNLDGARLEFELVLKSENSIKAELSVSHAGRIRWAKEKVHGKNLIEVLTTELNKFKYKVN